MNKGGEMKYLLSLFLLGTVFIVQYEGYYFDPCTCTGSTCMCLAIDGYNVAPKTHFCDDVKCVEGILSEYGVEHLEGVFMLHYGFPIDKQEATIERVEVVHKITIE
jgi:hypothetical protein